MDWGDMWIGGEERWWKSGRPALEFRTEFISALKCLMPLVRSLGKGLWEVRSTLDTRIARVIFFIDNQKMVLLHGFIK